MSCSGTKNSTPRDANAAALDDAEEDVVRLRTLERDLETELVAVERHRGRDVPDDEERRDAGDLSARHGTSPPRSLLDPLEDGLLLLLRGRER